MVLHGTVKEMKKKLPALIKELAAKGVNTAADLAKLNRQLAVRS